MKKARWQLIGAMLFFGSVSLPVRALPFSSAQISLARGWLGCLFLVLISFLIGQKPRPDHIRANLLPLLTAGLGIGGNWILLFQAYRFTTVANATLCYYFAPVLVLFLSPFLLGERLRPGRVLCVLAATAGMVCVIGSKGLSGSVRPAAGILFGLGAAVLYAVVMLSNQFLRGISDLERSIAQLLIASLFLLAYVGIFEDVRPLLHPGPGSGLLLLVLGILYTGVAYYLYFAGMARLNAQTVALYSYIDPAFAIFFSAVFFREPLTPLQLFGGILILGATFLPEWRAARTRHGD